jgi:4-hydroxy-4-methyl-2-oxoglutarate aldolase
MTTYKNPDIRLNFERTPASTIATAAQFPSSIVADVAGRRGGMHGRIAPVKASMRFAGPAFTVEVRAGDNLMIHAAMALAKPGDVLVIDGQADQCCALMGSIMINACKKLGLAGVVIDAAVRDTLELAELDFPVFAVGTNPNGPTKMVAGRIGHPVSCGDVVVHAGDFVCGDADGVTVVERDKIEALLPLAIKKVDDEAKRIAQIKEGNTASPWLNAALVAAGALHAGETV